MKGAENSTGFGQSDPSDGRELLDWQSKYPAEARHAIRVEAIYLGILLAILPAFMFCLWLDFPKYWMHLSDQKYGTVLKYGLAWTAGTLGGTLFDIKWLYHTVARKLWHMDRRLRRVFTPHVSGGLAFAVLALIASGGLRIFDSKATASRQLVVGLGFLVGYFSDSAIAKLSEVADTLFGTSRSKEKHKPNGDGAVPAVDVSTAGTP
jgi:hypothetical protein